MRTALFFLLVLAVGTAGAMWLAGLGGSVEVRVGEAFLATSFALALLILALAFLVLYLILFAIGALRRLPGRMRRERAMRHRQEGDAAVTRALIALAAGTPDGARQEVRKARSLLGDTPQTLLLAAEAERLAGDEDGAAAVFRQLAERDDAKFLGLRGLLRQAMQRGDWDAARAIAKEAAATQPGANWLKEERTQLALETRDWREALALAEPEQPRAALALAAAEQEPDPERSMDYVRQAFRFDRGFAPAALELARRLREQGHPRQARGVLEEAWGAAPHPDLGEAYVEGEQSPLERLRVAENLMRRNPEAAESRLLIGRLAIAAGLYDRARRALEPLVASGEADRRAFLLVSELEEAERGDSEEGRTARMRLLQQAAAAPPEPRWRCGHCGAEHGRWAPVCEACDTPGQIVWTTAQPAEAEARAA